MGFVVVIIFRVLNFFLRFWSVPTSLIFIMRELAGGAYVAVAVAVNDNLPHMLRDSVFPIYRNFDIPVCLMKIRLIG